MSKGNVVLSSDYLEAAKNVYSSNNKPLLQVFVEGDPDVRFWMPLINKYQHKYETHINRAYDINVGDDKQANGCSRISSLVNSGALILGPYLLVCIDSDYKFILNDYSEEYNFVIDNPYVFETIVCAKENVISSPEGIREIIQKSISLSSWFVGFSFKSFFKDFSNFFFLLHAIYLFYYKNKRAESQLVYSFISRELSAIKESVDALSYVNMNNANIFNIFHNKKGVHKSFIKSVLNQNDRTEFFVFAKAMKKRMNGIENTAYFMRGHDYYDSFFKGIVSKMSYLLLEEEKRKRLSANDRDGVGQMFNNKCPPHHLMENREDIFRCGFFQLTLDKINNTLN